MRGPRGIFISYRRSTSAGYAGRIRDHLIERYGDDAVFMDVDSIAPGTDYVDAIDASLRESRAVLVVVDPGWATVPNANGQPRLNDPNDWVRTEIERALIRAADDNLALIPVLVGGAEFPAQDQLPETIGALTRYNGVELRDTHFESDLDDVMDRLGGGWRRWVQLGVGGAAVAALVLVLAWLAFRDTTPDVTTLDSSPMVSDLNIAVAEFTTLDESGSVIVDPEFTLDVDIARELEDQLAGLAEAKVTSDIRAPESTGTVDGRDQAERAASAAELAERIDADVVIYGFREPTSPQAITPEFYVSTQDFGDALELAGPYPMGARISDSARLDTASRRALRLEVLARTGALANFAVGVSNLKLDRPEDARVWFESALEEVGQWATDTNSEVFHLYLGSAKLRLDDLDGAQAAYETALALQPNYARAMIGLAEVQFQQSRGRCLEGTTDDAGLLEALRRFDEAAAQPAPATAQIQHKAALGRGRVLACRSQAGDASDWEAASEELTEVIDAYEGGLYEIKEFAALAYGARATTSLRLDEGIPTEPALRSAAVDLESGFALSEQKSVQDSYAGLLGFVYDLLGDSAESDRWCELTEDKSSCPAPMPTTSVSAPADSDDAEPEEPLTEEPITDEPITDEPLTPEEPSATSEQPTPASSGDGSSDDSGNSADRSEPAPPEDSFPDVFGAPLPSTR